MPDQSPAPAPSSARRSEHYFDRVIVIESTTDTIRTGQYLVKDFFADEKRKNPQLELETPYHEPHSRAEFEALLAKIAHDTEREGHRPIIHLEMHGKEDQAGLVFASEETMTWDELADLLTPINRASRNNLFVVLAVCYGAAMKEILEAQRERAPVFGLVGHTDTIHQKNFPRGFRAFYKEIVFAADGDQALVELNDEGKEEKEDVEYRLRTAEGAFRDRLRNPVKNFTDKKTKSRKIDDLLTIGMQHQKSQPLGLGKTRKIVKGKIKQLEQTFNAMLDKYLMVDLFPEERERFSLTYQDVSSAASKLVD